jgi:hypothetical protein
MLSRAWLSVQKTLNVGVGARINTLEAFTAKGGPDKDDRGGRGTGGGAHPRR